MKSRDGVGVYPGVSTRYAAWKFAGNFLLNHQRGVMRENLRTQRGRETFRRGKSSREGVKFTRETFSNVARRRRSFSEATNARALNGILMKSHAVYELPRRLNYGK